MRGENYLAANARPVVGPGAQLPEVPVAVQVVALAELPADSPQTLAHATDAVSAVITPGLNNQSDHY